MQERDERLSTDEIAILVTGLVGAGSETTALGGMAAIRILLAHPEVTERVRADRSLLPGTVNEMLRFAFGAGGVPRYALRDFELRGRSIREGQMLMLSFGSAGRDPRVYPEPDRFDIMREPPAEHLAFSGGIHYCLGSPLARLELTRAFRALAERFPKIRQTGPTTMRPGTTLRGPLRFPMAVS